MDFFLRLLAIPGITLTSLQPGACLPEQSPLQIPASPIEDFADLAAAIAGMDLVITVDHVIAHLAGALGKPTWILLPFAPDWRWMLDREDTPWYPTAQLFRQQHPGDWHGVFKRVAWSLRAWVESRE
jgi:ADP-heptose:LPS heptosyltransferase